MSDEVPNGAEPDVGSDLDLETEPVHIYPEPLPFAADPVAEAFYAGAAGRIRRLVPLLGGGLTLGAWLWFGLPVAAGFALGAVIAAVNHRWMEQGISALLDRVAATGQRGSGVGVLLRFLSRFGLVLGAAYVTLASSHRSLYGFLAGLFVPVAAILCEAAYEAWGALRRGL